MRLVDCFIELFYYTIFLKSLGFEQLSFKDVRDHYKQLLSRAIEAAKKADFAKREWNLGLFAICAWIDETILCSGWSERDRWSRSSLQFVLFKTTNAGSEFFSRLAGLRKNDKSIREVFDYCLALGFKGSHYLSRDAEKLQEIKEANLKLVTENQNLSFPKLLFPDAYVASFKYSKKRMRAWGRAFLIAASIIIPVAIFTVIFLIFKNELNELFSAYTSAGL